MNESNSKPKKPKGQPRSSQDQYDMLKRCSDKNDMTEWNEWRKKHPDEDILLDGRAFKGWWLEKVNFIGETVWRQADGTEINFTGKVNLEEARFDSASLQKAIFGKAHLEGSYFWHADVKGADFHSAHLDNSKLGVAHFENCNFTDAILVNANFSPSNLNGAKFTNADLKGCSMRACVVDGSTRFWNCHINRYSKSERFTDLTGTALNNVIITPREKQLFEYNVRRMNWEAWYKYKNWHRSENERNRVVQKLMWFIKLFWSFSEYGRSTWKIIIWFLIFSVSFAFVYWLFPFLIRVDDPVENIRGFWHALYFSVVTMTTLGFGDIAANPDSWAGQTLLMAQVILGYVLLGALVTRFAVLFTAGGPAGKFADE